MMMNKINNFLPYILVGAIIFLFFQVASLKYDNKRQWESMSESAELSLESADALSTLIYAHLRHQHNMR